MATFFDHCRNRMVRIRPRNGSGSFRHIFSVVWSNKSIGAVIVSAPRRYRSQCTPNLTTKQMGCTRQIRRTALGWATPTTMPCNCVTKTARRSDTPGGCIGLSVKTTWRGFGAYAPECPLADGGIYRCVCHAFELV